MALRDRFPFDKILKFLDKLLSVADYIKLLLEALKAKRRASGK